MGFTLYNLFKSGLLVTNGVAVLHRKRFLRKYKLDEVHPGEQAGPMRVQVIGLLNAIQYLKLPLIALNIMTIVLELVFGG